MRPSGSPASDAPVIVDALRSPIGTRDHALGQVDASSLAAPVISALVERGHLDPDRADEVVLGNCMGPGGNLARYSALEAGLPVSVPAVTVDRQCASGLAAILQACQVVREHRGQQAIAGGAESASTAPWRYWRPAPGEQPQRYERAPFAPADIGDPDMGAAADLIAAEYAVSREAQDRYAVRSHERAAAAQAAGHFDAEIVPVAGVTRDERPRAGLTTARLARLRPAFGPDGTVTAGNACGVSDGAAMTVVSSAAAYRRNPVPGLRVLATATTAHDPRRPGLGIVAATATALKRAGMSWFDIDVVEFNEAFAGQVLACCAALGLDPERVCPQGGALALGHPWGASGAVLVVRLFSQLVRTGRGGLGLAAIAAGGGQGVAMVVEACH
jgi:acetyl-CoA C-acetyltransferase